MTSPTEALQHERDEQRRAILNMVAGPVLDAEVHRVVFGHRLRNVKGTWVQEDDPGGQWKPVPPYSTAVASAWSVVEQMRPKYAIEIRDRDERLHQAVWEVELDPYEAIPGGWAQAETFPLAACRAALLATFEARQP
jgi:hypothetical protein